MSHKIILDLQGALSAIRGLAPGGLGTRQEEFSAFFLGGGG